MPFFESSTGVLIKDSNFYDIGGDINIHTAPPMMWQDREALEGCSDGGLGHQLEGSERNDGHAGAEDNSPWPQVGGGSDNQYLPHNCPDPWSMSTLNSSLPSVQHPFLHPPPPGSTESLFSPSNPLPYLFSQPQSGFRAIPFDSEQEYTPGSRDPRTASYITSQDPFEPSSYTTLEHVHPPFAYTHPSSASFPDSIPLQNVFELQSGPVFETFFYPPGVIDDGSRSQYSTDHYGFYPGAPNRAITYQQSHFELHYGTPSGSNYPFPSEDGGRGLESNATLIDHPDFLWDRPQEGPRTNIQGSTFISHVQRSGETGLQLLYRASVADALHNSVERYPQPKCHPETRTEILDSLWNWTCGIEPLVESQDYEWTRDAHSFFGDSSASNILWLYGPAGAGKSAIAQSLCQRIEAESSVAASFFFKRGHASRGNANRLFPTIAYQLAILLPKLKDYISQMVENDPAIVDKSLSIQLQKLIVEPWQQMIPSSRAVIIIDGLDECDGQDVQQEILRSICYAIHEMKLSVQFLITSRPEPHISEMFHTPPLDKYHRPVNVEQSFEDVRKYLSDEFTRIHRDHETMARVSKPWPTAEDIEHLVDNSSGYFIYASTVIKFIDDKNFRPTDRLDIIMGLAERDLESPLAALDQLYTQILSAIPGRPQLLRILTVIGEDYNLTADLIEQLLELKPGDVGLALRGLHALVEINVFDDDAAITVHHASFLDFLNDPTRSGLFNINSQHRSDLARQILKAFSYKYEDPSLNESEPVVRHFGMEAFKFIISVKPSPDLVSLLQGLNPDFLFDLLAYEQPHTVATDILEWLEEIHPRPQGLFELWEDYAFMLQCDYAWSSRKIHITYDHDYGEILSQAPPQLLKILHACTITNWSYSESSLVRTHFLLDLSWNELRKSICPLREIMDTYDGKLDELFTYASDPKFCPKPTSIFSELSREYLRVMRSILDHKLPWHLRWHVVGDKWGGVLRSCPPCDDMLRDLRELEFASAGTSLLDYTGLDDFHNVLQWLKTFPEPSHDLIARFEQHLEHRKIKYLEYEVRKTSDELEVDWISWRKKMVGSFASLQEMGQVSQYDGTLGHPMFS
ncbi:hypothetical protein C8R44DRAFT_878843 [Mycena epipterygia]|nr:hypothetical protein C8R44DRAFT_878843 [Mycena epipterygia]